MTSNIHSVQIKNIGYLIIGKGFTFNLDVSVSVKSSYTNL